MYISSHASLAYSSLVCAPDHVVLDLQQMPQGRGATFSHCRVTWVKVDLLQCLEVVATGHGGQHHWARSGWDTWRQAPRLVQVPLGYGGHGQRDVP